MLQTGKEDIGIRLRLEPDVSNNPMVAKASAFGDRHPACGITSITVPAT